MARQTYGGPESGIDRFIVVNGRWAVGQYWTDQGAAKRYAAYMNGGELPAS
jgi:hypothetical protein